MIAACYMGHLECVRELIIWGANIEMQDQDGRTALSVAVTCDSDSAAKLVTLLIDNGANSNKNDKDGMSPLLIAAFEGKAEVCEILLENSADMDHADKEGKTALFAAASMGHLDILNLLMFWGCYIDGIDCEGRTVLSVAAAEGSAPIVKVRGIYFPLENQLSPLSSHENQFPPFFKNNISIIRSKEKG